jgi:hypothetical protein
LTLQNTIVAGNTATTVPDLDGQSFAISGGHNLIGDAAGLSGTGFADTDTRGDIVGHPAQLGALADNGGFTRTMALQTGSSASPAVGRGGAITAVAQGATATATSLTVADAAVIASTPGQYFIMIDGEEMEVTAVDLVNNILTVVRGVNGATATPHQNDPVYLFSDQRGFRVTAGLTPDIGAYQTQTATTAPAFTSPTKVTFTAGTAASFTVAASGVPTPLLTEDATDTLPAGISFNPDTGVLGGVPGAAAGGAFTLHFTAQSGSGSSQSQIFTLTVNAAPKFTNPAITGFAVGTSSSFTVTTTGFPAPALSLVGKLPAGVTFNAATGVLSGTPSTVGTYTLHLTAHNGIGKDATQTFTLIVGTAPAFTSGASATFTAGSRGVFTIKAGGSPKAVLSEDPGDLLPRGITFNAATGVLSGIAGALTGGVYTLHFTAHTGVGADATQMFTLTVKQAPAFTSPATATFVEKTGGSFTVIANAYPTATLSESATDTLPNGVTFNPSSGVLTVTAQAVSGIYALHFVAHNGIGKDARQTFTLIVTPLTLTLNPPAPTEGAPLKTIVVGTFTDVDNVAGTTTGYTATVRWGDGQISSTSAHNVIIQADPAHAGVFDIVATKPSAYTEESAGLTFSVSLSARRFVAAASARIAVADAALSLTLSPPAPIANRPLTKVLVGTFTDADPRAAASDYIATVSWGDGQSSASPATVFIKADPLHKGIFDIFATKPKPYTQAQTGLIFSVTVNDKGGASASKSASITVTS